MLIIGERINTFRRRVMKAYENKESDYIRSEALRQAECGARVIDINAGADIDVEPKNMAWAVEIVQEAVDLPLCIDSPNPDTIKAGFAACKDKHSAWVNSITMEKERYQNLLPLAKEHDCPVIALCRGESGMVQSAADRVEAAKQIVETVDRFGVSLDKLYLDPMIEPLSVNTEAGLVSLQTLRQLKQTFPDISTVISLSGISFGLPGRKLLHSTYMPMLMYEQLDAVFLDPYDGVLMASIVAADALLNGDEFCMGYITAQREGKFEG